MGRGGRGGHPPLQTAAEARTAGPAPFVTGDTFPDGPLTRSTDAPLDRHFRSHAAPHPAILPGRCPLICPGTSRVLPLKRGFKTVPGLHGSQLSWKTLPCINASEDIRPQAAVGAAAFPSLSCCAKRRDLSQCCPSELGVPGPPHSHFRDMEFGTEYKWAEHKYRPTTWPSDGEALRGTFPLPVPESKEKENLSMQVVKDRPRSATVRGTRPAPSVTCTRSFPYAPGVCQSCQVDKTTR